MASIYLKIRINGEASKPIPMDIEWFPNLFNPLTGECKPKKGYEREAQDNSIKLGEERSKANSIVTDYRLGRRPIDLLRFLDDYNNYHAKRCLIQFMRREMEWRRIHDFTIEEQSLKSHKTTIGKLTEYAMYKGWSEIKFSSLNSKWAIEFNSYLKTVCGLNNNYRYILHKNVRTYIKRALKQRNKFENPYDSFSISEEEIEIPCLEEHEIVAIWNFYKEQKPGTFWRMLCQKIIACIEGGFRISDLNLITPEKVNFITKRIVFTPYKQRKPTKKRPNGLVLNNLLTDRCIQVMLDSIRENTEIQKLRKSRLIFVKHAEAYENRKMKDLSKELKIPSELHWHLFRHTCATHLATNGLNVKELMIYFGWSDERTALRYVNPTRSMLDDKIGRMNFRSA